jgi:hypothetical protein
VTELRAFADTWSALYSNSPVIRSLLAFVHIGGLVAAGGVAVTADIATLKALARGGMTLPLELERLHATHRLVIVSLALVVASGILLMFADLDAYLQSTAFWIKMTLVVALLANGGFLVRAGRPTPQPGRGECLRLRIVSIASLALWFGTTLLGAILPNAV